MVNIDNAKFQKKYRNILIIITIFFFVIMLGYGYLIYGNVVPSNIRIVLNEEDEFKSLIPVTAKFDKDCVGAISIDDKVIDNKRLNININDDFSVKGNRVGKYKANLKAFGVLSLKKINVEIVNNKKLIVGGVPVGIYVETDGLMVLGTGDIIGEDNMEYSPAKNILKSGDYIIAINGKQINNKQKFIQYIQSVKEEDLNLTIRRNDKNVHVAVKKLKCKDGSYKIGAWIRNNMQGVGTLTYYDEASNRYGALGHGINDIDTNKLMEIKKGNIYTARIANIVKGQVNKPGELVGIINHNEKYQIGSLNKNISNGIYGIMDTSGKKNLLGQLDNDNLDDEYSIGLHNNVKIGKAKLRCTIGDKVGEYNIRIVKKNEMSSSSNKNFVLRITDSKLLKLTNGIVQGMSGSPIIQNNKIIGALTHVFVNDPTKGYGIYIENMINYSK